MAQDTTMNFQFTQLGVDLATKALAGTTKITFTKAVASSENHFSDTEATALALTTLGEVQQTIEIKTVMAVTDNKAQVKVPVVIDRGAITTDYSLLSIGLYAKDDDGTEVLYAVNGLQDAVEMRANAFNSTYSIDLYVAVGTSDNVTLTVDAAGMVTHADFDAMMKRVAFIDKANTFTEQQTLAGGAVDGAGNAIATTKNLADGDVETLTSAKAYADTKVSGKADDSKVVHTADMRKPASDVAGIEEVNAVDAKGLARNLVANSGYMVNLDKWIGDYGGSNGGSLVLSTHSLYHNGTGNVIKLNNTKTSEVYAKSDWFKVKTNTQYTFQFILFGTINTSSTDVWLIGQGTNATSIIAGYVQSPIKAELITKTFTTGNFEDAYIRVDNNGSKDGNNCYIAFTEVQLEEGTVAHSWTPSFSDLVHRVADNGDGSIRVNGNSYTPADDSKVLHNSGLATIPNDNSALVVGNNGDIGLIKKGGATGALGVGSNNTFRIVQSNNTSIGIADTFHDMFKVNSNYQISLGPGAYFTPANDAKVPHLSGANNFDTVPTVNNNPLLLASSLPADLARTSQQTNFTAGLQSNGTAVATTDYVDGKFQQAIDQIQPLIDAEMKKRNVPSYFWSGDATAYAAVTPKVADADYSVFEGA